MEEDVRKSVGAAVIGSLLLAGMPEVPTLNAAQARPVMDTTRTRPPLHFRNSAFFDTRYLYRAADAVVERYRGAPAVEASATASVTETAEGDEAAKKVEALASRYGVSRTLARKIVDVALAEGIDPELGFRMIRVESGFKTTARGAMGAAGLLQIMPSTARTLDRSVDTRQELLDPGTNLRLGFHYLRQMIERYDGDVRLGVLAYNRGEIAVDRALKRGRDPENGYSHKVLGTRGGHPYKGDGLVAKAKKKKS
jgi:soluble lytic murein transglycosylase-like protein